MLVGWAEVEAEALWKVTAGNVVARFGCCAGVHSALQICRRTGRPSSSRRIWRGRNITIIRGRIANHYRAVCELCV